MSEAPDGVRREPVVYAPADRPPVEVLDEGIWCFGILRMWSWRDDGWVADVAFYRPGATSPAIGTFAADQVRKDTVDRSRGRT